MKFAQRLSCAVLLLLAGVFSLGGFVLVYINAADMLRQAAAQVEQWHRMQYYTLETQVLGMMARGEDVTDDALLESAMRIADFGEDGSQSGIWLENSDGIMLFSSLGAAAAEASASVGPIGAQEYYLRRAQGNTYLLLESTISAPNKSYRLRTLSDVTGVFVARDRQLARFWCMEAGALGVCALAIVLLTKRMTRPLDELYGASRRIARGDYSARAEVATQDEIGSVAESFNAMAAAVQKNVDTLALSARQREEFMGAFTHELKTPMTAIIGYADTLRTLELDPEGRRPGRERKRASNAERRSQAGRRGPRGLFEKSAGAGGRQRVCVRQLWREGLHPCGHSVQAGVRKHLWGVHAVFVQPELRARFARRHAGGQGLRHRNRNGGP